MSVPDKAAAFAVLDRYLELGASYKDIRNFCCDMLIRRQEWEAHCRDLGGALKGNPTWGYRLYPSTKVG